MAGADPKGRSGLLLTLVEAAGSAVEHYMMKLF